MAIVIVRHGETALNAARVVQPKDTPLNERGVAQAQRLAERLATTRISSVLCSDLERTRMTCAPLLAATGLTAEYSPLLRERDFGVWCGTPYDELTVDLFGPDYDPPEGESWDVFHERVERAYRLIAAHAQGLPGDLVVITHGWVVRRLVTHYGAPEAGTEWPPIWFNTGVSTLAAEPPHSVASFNCIRHLQAENGPRGISGL